MTFGPRGKRATTAFRDRYGPWALVTGASSGIGREIALQAAARGLDVLLAGRDARRLEETAHVIRSAGRQALWVAGNLATDEGMASLVAAASALDIGLLVPAAGFGIGGEFLALPDDEAAAMVRLNCDHVTRLVLRFAPPMARRGHGAVLLVASVLAFHGVPYAALYAASKAFVQSLGEALAVELAPHGVDVVVSSPGPTATGFASRARMRLGRTLQAADVADASLRGLGHSRVVLPGALTKVLHNATFGLPRAAKVLVLGRIMRGMT